MRGTQTQPLSRCMKVWRFPLDAQLLKHSGCESCRLGSGLCPDFGRPEGETLSKQKATHGKPKRCRHAALGVSHCVTPFGSLFV